MPLYEYQCDACGHRFETIQKFSDLPIETCPKCGGAVKKLQSAPAFHLKGSGWYVTDYAKKDQASADKGDKADKADKADRADRADTGSKESAAESKDSSKAEQKTDQKAEQKPEPKTDKGEKSTSTDTKPSSKPEA
jgi:putative FmdB family regulatory protein